MNLWARTKEKRDHQLVKSGRLQLAARSLSQRCKNGTLCLSRLKTNSLTSGL